MEHWPQMGYVAAKSFSQNIRSSRLQIFFKIGDLKNFAIFTGKHLF